MARVALLLALILTLPAFGQVALPEDPAALLGLDLKALHEAYGPPASVASFRGPEAWQDDVVFRYPGGLSFFIYKDRVWQVRFDKTWTGSIYGLARGASAEEAAAVLGSPEKVEGDSAWYRRPDRGFPVRLRIAMVEGRAVDFYLYRADF